MQQQYVFSIAEVIIRLLQSRYNNKNQRGSSSRNRGGSGIKKWLGIFSINYLYLLISLVKYVSLVDRGGDW